MVNRFEDRLKNLCKIFPRDKILLTVSGGIDSIVMLDLFSKCSNKIAIAHCNFNLRNEESDADEKFVQKLGEKYSLPVYLKKFDTLNYADDNKLSIQMAARDLRYQWFEELRIETGFNFIATAHTMDDQVETFFINLSRGTGIKGLTGIKASTGNIIRPLLWAERAEILEYATQNQLNWREDSSNSSSKYLRNKIRHEIIPLFKDINPGFSDTMKMNIQRLKEVEKVFDGEAENKKKKLLIKDGKMWKISIKDLLEEKNARIWLYEILQGFGFVSATIDDLFQSLIKSESGKLFFSEKYRIVKDREYLILDTLEVETMHRYYIEEGQENISEPIRLHLKQIPNVEFEMKKSNLIAQLDYDRLIFPLIIRKWNIGDYFMPLGMNNLKKLSDFFIDQKLSIPEKEKTWLLTSGKHIVWVIGMRIDERYKVKEGTEMVLSLELTRE